MITASIILFNTNKEMVTQVMKCAALSCIERIYVIDNSPTDKLKYLVENLSEKIEYNFGHGNIGYGAGHNIALKKAIIARANYHVILNPDIHFSEGTIENLICFCNKHCDIGSVMPNVVYPDGRQQYLCKMSPTPLDMFGRRLLPKRIIEKRNNRFEMRSTGYKDIRNVPCLSGCFMFLNMKVIKQVGLFDDRFFMYFEDFDLIRRIHKISKTVFYPKVTIIHNHAAEHHTNKKLLKISIQSAIRYFNKWGWILDRDRWYMNKHAFDKENIIAE